MKKTNTLSINKKHFSRQTIFTIDEEVFTNNYECFLVKKVGTSDYLIAVNEQYFNAHSRFKFDIPKDLQAIVTMALDIGCTLIYINDQEAVSTYLPVYEYPMILNDFSEKVMHEQIYHNGVMISDKDMSLR